MASFLTDLWDSVFIPGPTSSLLLATNVSFASLQVVLFALLVATYSIHFVILSGLCAGLWFSINWFVKELKAVQAQQEAQAKEEKEKLPSSDTETETEPQAKAVVEGGESGSKEVEVVERVGELKRTAAGGAESGHSTEDEWEKVSENEKDK